MRSSLPPCLLVLATLASPASAQTATTVLLPELHQPARIVRDLDGIPHLEAADEHNLLVLQGWVHANDRLFQMDLQRRQPSGTLAELLGLAALPGDIPARTIGARRAAALTLPALAPQTRDALQAYADGVNAWVRDHPLPLEYAALELTRFAPWTPEDSVVVAKAIVLSLSFFVEVEPTLHFLSYVAAGQALGFNGAVFHNEDVARVSPFHAVPIVPPDEWRQMAAPVAASAGDAAALPAIADVDMRAWRPLLDAARRSRTWLAQSPWLAATLRDDHRRNSNSWVVAGAHTRSGRPLLANDPHLGYGVPPQFHPLHLRGGDFDVAGMTIAGVPFVILGHNARVAWGFTTNSIDVTDTFQEVVVPASGSPSGLASMHRGAAEAIDAIPETYYANDPANGVLDDVTLVPPGPSIPAATLIVPRHGPVIDLDVAAGTALTVQWAGAQATFELDAARAWNQARDVFELQTAFAGFDVASQNVLCADVEGNIGYFATGEVPVREDLQAMSVHAMPPWFIRDGTGGNEWLPVQTRHPGQALPFEVLAPSEMPQLFNPARGWIATANNDPLGLLFDNDILNSQRRGGGIYYLDAGYERGFRAGRIDTLLRAALAHSAKLDVEDMRRIQADVTAADAGWLVPHIVRAFERTGAAGVDPRLRALGASAALREAIGRLARWDGRSPTGIVEGADAADPAGQRAAPTLAEIRDSVAATLFNVWRPRVIDRTAAVIPQSLGIPARGDTALVLLRRLLEDFAQSQGIGASGVDFFPVPGVARAEDRRDIVLLEALDDALQLLAGPAFESAFARSTNQADYRWGLLNRAVFDHPLGGPFSLPPLFGAIAPPLPALTGFPTDGGAFCVDVAHPAIPLLPDAESFTTRAGPLHRMIVGFDGQGPSARLSLSGTAGAAAGAPLSLFEHWLTNDDVPFAFRPAAVSAAKVSVIELRP